MATPVNKQCRPEGDGITRLEPDEISSHLELLNEAWKVVAQRRLKRDFSFSGFMEAMIFVNDIAALAEAINHHPDMHIRFKQVTIELTTHDVEGLSELDFVLAHKIELCC